MRPATTAIQKTLMMPSAKSDPIMAQQHPMHEVPCRIPICSAPDLPSRQAPRRKPSGLRHFLQTDVFEWSEFVDGGNDEDHSGTHRPDLPHSSASPQRCPPAAATANARTPTAPHATK